jgi:glycine betaine/choline ABC-type transport system substrate-binding protein
VRTLTALVIAAAAALSACGDDEQKIRVGYKDFTEQRILASIASHLLRDAGAGTEQVPCGDTFKCQQLLRRGEIDLMFEYTGTGFFYSGAVLKGRANISEVRKLYKPLGMRWMDPVGFDNGYVLVMTRSRATELGVSTIADLGEHARKLRFAVPHTYIGRPSDGYGSLLERHGIISRSEPILEQSPVDRIEAVLGGRVDVAVAYRTDGELMGLDLIELQDSLGFFPPYEAAVLMREDFAANNPALVDALAVLQGKLDAPTMRALNYRAGVEGEAVESVADRFLTSIGMVPAPPDEAAPSLLVAVANSDRLGRETEMALRMVRQAFPGRRLALIQVDDPAAGLLDGKSRLALMGAERLFIHRGAAITRRSDIEAIAVANQRLVHVLYPHGKVGKLQGRIGVGPKGSGSAKVGSEILATIGGSPASYDETPNLVASLAEGKLDAAIVLASPGDTQISEALARHQVELAGLTDPSLRSRLPHLRPARIPPSTYAEQTQPIETLHSQVVLVGPAPRTRTAMMGGPNAHLLGAAQPLTVEEARALVSASDAKQLPDAMLPSIWSRVNERSLPDTDATNSAVETALNLAVFVFIGWLVILTFRRDLDE